MTRPVWAYVVLGLGFIGSLVVLYLTIRYEVELARGGSPALGMAYTVGLLPLLVVSAPLMLVGTVGAIRPWSSERWWFFTAAVVGVGLWFIAILLVPSLIADRV